MYRLKRFYQNVMTAPVEKRRVSLQGQAATVPASAVNEHDDPVLASAHFVPLPKEGELIEGVGKI